MKNLIKRILNPERANNRRQFKRVRQKDFKWARHIYSNTYDNFDGEYMCFEGFVLQVEPKNEKSEITYEHLNDLKLQLENLGIKPNGMTLMPWNISIDWSSENYSILLSKRSSKKLASEFENYLKPLKLNNLKITLCSMLFSPTTINNKFIVTAPHFNNEYFGKEEIMIMDHRPKKANAKYKPYLIPIAK